MGAFRAVAVGVGRSLGLAALCSLPACHPEPKQRTSVEKPPPKPPHCPQSAELKNITLADGSIADVRIFHDGEQVFYVPFYWYRWQLAHYNLNEPYQSPPGMYDPDVSDSECPGVIHRGNFAYSKPMADFARGNIPPNFAPDSALDQVTFFKAAPGSPYVTKGVPEDLQPLGIRYEAFIRVGNRHYARYPIYVEGPGRWTGPEWDDFRAKVMASADWGNKRDAVRELFTWLQTPPRARDNSRIFQLGRRR